MNKILICFSILFVFIQGISVGILIQDYRWQKAFYYYVMEKGNE
jgi:hypothetical protein